MSIFSSISSGLKSVAKGVYNTVNTIGSTLAGGFSKIGNQAASVYNAVTPSGGNQSTYNSSTYKPPIQPTGISGTGTTYYNGYVPSTGSYIPSNASQGGAGFGSYGPQLPVTITAGKVSSGGSSSSSSSSFAAPYATIQVASPRTLSKSGSPTASTSQFATSSFSGNSAPLTTSSFSGGSSPVSLASAPTSTNPQINTSGLAGTLSGYKKYNATTGQYEDIPDEQVIQERKNLYDRFVGKAESVYDDPEVQAARKQRQDIKQRLRGPTDELNAIVAQQQRDLLQLRQTGSQEGVTEAVYGGQSNAINYNAAIRALPLQASIASLQGDLELTQDYIKDLVQVKSEQIKNQREYNIGLYNAIAPALDKNEQRIYDAGLKEIERQTKKEDELVKFQAAISQKVMQNAPESVRTNVNSRLWAADSIQGVIEAAGKYGVEPNTEIRQLDNGSTVVIDKNTNKIISELGGAKPTTTGGGVLATLPTSIQGKIVSIANGFGDKPNIKKYIEAVDSNNIVSAIDPKSKNPADHQQIIYAFAKALDPDSAVKEGEYDTIRKYAQSTLSRYKKQITNAIAGTGFLSEDAIKDIQTTIANTLNSRRPVYENSVRETKKVINNIAGSNVADEIMIDYTGGIRGSGSQSVPVTSGSLPSGITFKVVK